MPEKEHYIKNFGPKTRARLAEIGVYELADIERLGSIAIYRRLQAQGPGITLNTLWALEAALLGLRWDKLPQDIKDELRRQLEQK